jgi:hypothetical protein
LNIADKNLCTAFNQTFCRRKPTFGSTDNAYRSAFWIHFSASSQTKNQKLRLIIAQCAPNDNAHLTSENSAAVYGKIFEQVFAPLTRLRRTLCKYLPKDF